LGGLFLGGLFLFGEGDVDGLVVAVGDDDGLGAVGVVGRFGGEGVGAFAELEGGATGDGAGCGVIGPLDG
jgi:hypothetical protein